MLTRRLLALCTLLCLLTGLLAAPRGPVLVCRMTGTLMSPVFVSGANKPDTCCDVIELLITADTIHYELVAPGCCELRQDTGRTASSAAPVAAPEIPTATLIRAPIVIPTPLMAAVISSRESPRESAPRAPPLISVSPRAPPVFS